MEKKVIKSEHSSNVNNKINLKEREYLERKLTSLIEREGRFKRIVQPGSWKLYPDPETQLKILVKGYILQHFTLLELYTIFFEEICDLSESNIKQRKMYILETIKDIKWLNSKEKKRLIGKVSGMNTILFGLLIDFLYDSHLFWELEGTEFDYNKSPDLSVLYLPVETEDSYEFSNLPF